MKLCRTPKMNEQKILIILNGAINYSEYKQKTGFTKKNAYSVCQIR